MPSLLYFNAPWSTLSYLVIGPSARLWIVMMTYVTDNYFLLCLNAMMFELRSASTVVTAALNLTLKTSLPFINKSFCAASHRDNRSHSCLAVCAGNDIPHFNRAATTSEIHTIPLGNQYKNQSNSKFLGNKFGIIASSVNITARTISAYRTA